MNRSSRHLLLPLALSIALGACTTMPSQPARAPSPAIEPVGSTPPTVAANAATVAPLPAADAWERLRGSFAMPDCNADPAVLAWAERYTRSPARFEDTLRDMLPRLSYVQQIAEQYNVPGEFVLLPWVESRFRPVQPRKHHAVGMWQIMSVTARSMGLRVDRHYDARLDMFAATHAVMKLLQQYHDRFHDWRVADYAYNAGEFKLRGLIRRHGTPPDVPVIPDLPVRRVTREHLTQLLAIACVIREPARFQVNLPALSNSQRLVRTRVTQPMTMARAADLAGMSTTALQHLNAAFRGKELDTRTASWLMLPAAHAERFESAMVDFASESTTTAHEPGEPQPERSTHVVNSGESLWQIAREYSTSVARLEQLNDLPRGQAIQPGQVLKLDDVD